MNVAFLFPGQGTQYVGMGKDIFEKYEPARMIYRTVSDRSGIDVAGLSFSGPASRLKKSENAQVAIVTMSLAIFHIITAAGIKPSIVAGHSLGEYSAIIAAGGLDIEDGAWLVSRRGEITSRPGIKFPGCMAAVSGLSSGEVEELCRYVEISGPVCVANYNTHRQFVISGEMNAVAAVIQMAREKGATAAYLPVSGAFHSPLMKEASLEFSELIIGIRGIRGIRIKDPVYPVIGNVKASTLTKSSEILEELTDQMSSPVRWCEMVEKMIAMGIQRFVEIGPGNVLKGLVLRINRRAEVFTTGSVRELEIAIERLAKEIEVGA